MRKTVLAVALAATASLPASAAPPVPPDEPLGGSRCSMGYARPPDRGIGVYNIVGLVPLLPFTFEGETVTDATLTCRIAIDPVTDAYPDVTLESTTQPVAGAGIMPPVLQVVHTGRRWSETRCQILTWTDSSGAPRSWSECTEHGGG